MPIVVGLAFAALLAVTGAALGLLYLIRIAATRWQRARAERRTGQSVRAALLAETADVTPPLPWAACPWCSGHGEDAGTCTCSEACEVIWCAQLPARKDTYLA